MKLPFKEFEISSYEMKSHVQILISTHDFKSRNEIA